MAVTCTTSPMSKLLPEIPFFGIHQNLIDNRGGKVYQMCNKIGGGGGSLRYILVTNNSNIIHSHTTIYPCILHVVKMRYKCSKSLAKTVPEVARYSPSFI